jgi:hypothetical protein
LSTSGGLNVEGTLSVKNPATFYNNVYIGTTKTPVGAAPLEVYDSTAGGSGIRVYRLDSVGQYLALDTSDGSKEQVIGYGKYLAIGAGSANQGVSFWSGGTANQMWLDSTGRLSIGAGTSPTAFLHLKAGTATANTAPMQFNSGPLETTPRAGLVEYLTDDWYITETNNTVRKKIVASCATADLTAQTAAITATTLFTPGASRAFRVSVVLHVTTAATTSSVLGGATGVVITYTEPDGSVAQSVTPLLLDQTGAVIVPATGNIGNSTTTTSQGSCVIYAKVGVAIQYAIGYTSVGVTPMAFSAHLKCEAL